MDINSFTNSVKEILAKSSEFATEKKSQSITSEMFLKAALTGSNLYSDILGRVNVDKVNLTHELDNEIVKVNSVEGDNINYASYLSNDLNALLIEANKYKEKYEDKFISEYKNNVKLKENKKKSKQQNAAGTEPKKLDKIFSYSCLVF